MAPPPRLLTIAGSDSGGGAGIQADLKTFAALGCYGMSAVTAVTAQNTVTVSSALVLPAQLVADQIGAVLNDLGVDAIKIGMLGSADIVRAVAEALREHPPIPMVLDPVMIAKSGDSLLADDAVTAVLEELLPLATLVTPNLPEAERLTGLSVRAHEGRIAAARRLVELGASAVLIKGGHGGAEEAKPENPIVDWLFDGTRLHRFENQRIVTSSDHGTGCTLSSAIAAELGSGVPLVRSVELGIEYLRRAIATAFPIGQGHGPVNHSGRYRFQER